MYAIIYILCQNLKLCSTNHCVGLILCAARQYVMSSCELAFEIMKEYDVHRYAHERLKDKNPSSRECRKPLIVYSRFSGSFSDPTNFPPLFSLIERDCIILQCWSSIKSFM